jgi:hypothetical protein
MPGWEKWGEVSREAVEEGEGYFEHPDAPLDDPQTGIDEIDILSKALGVKVVMKATGYEPLDMNEPIGEPYFRVRVEKLSDKKFREFAEKYKYDPSGCFIIRFHQIPDAIREMVRYGLLPKEILEDYKKAQEYKKRMITRLLEEYRNTEKEKAFRRV